MTARSMKCIGDTCKIVKESLPEIAGGVSKVATSLAALDLKSVGEAVVGSKETYAQKTKFEQELRQATLLLQQLKHTLERIRRRKYQVCAMDTVKDTVAQIEARLVEYADTSAVNRGFKAAYPVYYRQQLAQDLMVLSIAIQEVMLDTNSVMFNLEIMQTTKDKNQRQALLRDLQASCAR